MRRVAEIQNALQTLPVHDARNVADLQQHCLDERSWRRSGKPIRGILEIDDQHLSFARDVAM